MMLCANIGQFMSRSIKIVSANQIPVLFQTEIADDSAAGIEQSSIKNAL